MELAPSFYLDLKIELVRSKPWKGFESFELLSPSSDSNTWYVYTRWESEEAFLAWVHSPSFARGHAEANAQPVAHGAELLEFDVVLKAEKNK